MAGEFRLIPLLDVAHVLFGYPFDSKLFNSERLGVPLIRIRDLGTPGTCLFTTEAGYPRSVRVEPGDLLVGMDAEFRPHRWSGPEALLNQRVCKIAPKSGHRLDREFLRFALAEPLQEIERAKTGTTVVHLNKADLERVRVPWPPAEERRAIAQVLGTLDDKIELNRRMSETLEAMARALFKAWFVDFEPVRAKMEGRWQRGQSLPGLPAHLYDLFSDRLVDSELGEIPEEWEEGTLADFSTLNPEVWTQETRPARINYVDLSNTKWGRIEAVTSYEAAEAPSRAQRVLRPGDTIVGTVRPANGSYAFICEAGLTGSTGFAVLRPRTADYAEFVNLAATAADNIETLAHLADGAAYPAVRPQLVAATPIVRPPDEVLVRFSQAAGPILAKIAANERQSRALAALRDALLPRLISGELRVRHEEPFLKERAL